jgi:hypothetical protein
MNTVSLAVMVALAGLQAAAPQTPATQAPAPQTPAAQAPKLITFNDPQLGLLFDHPPTWVVQKNKKGHAKSKTEQGLTVMTLPTSTSPNGATLEIFHARFASTPDIWQTVQLRSNEQLNRTVERQWQQDILGVPLLLTRISYTDKSVPTTTLTGLLYTRTHQKLLFRLVGPTSDFDNVQYSFTTAMQTLRTVDGTMPVEEDPDHPLPPAKKSDPLPSARIPLMADVKPPKLVVAPNAVKLVVSTKGLAFHYPNDWTVEKTSGTTITFKNEDVSGPVTLTFYSSLDSDPAATALMNLTMQDLSMFDSIALRLDSPALVNKAGCTVNTVWRIGKNSKGVLYTFQAVGQQGDYYFIADFKGTGDDSDEDDKKEIDKFIKAVSLLPRP